MVLGVRLIAAPVFKADCNEEDLKTLPELDGFKSKAQRILSELSQLESRFN